MKALPNGIKYGLCSYTDRRKSLVSLPKGYVQSALADADYQTLSAEFGINVALIKTVIGVESAGSGFLLNEAAPARPKILFEARWFYDLTPQPVSKTRPDLSSPTWNRSLYKGGSAEWDRLMDAIGFDEVAALKSASWGMGQVMGFNFGVAGCASVQQFVTENFAGEYWQARHMLNFIKSNGLMDKLRRADWAGFARGYNGEGYRQNQYDRKLADAYRRFS